MNNYNKQQTLTTEWFFMRNFLFKQKKNKINIKKQKIKSLWLKQKWQKMKYKNIWIKKFLESFKVLECSNWKKIELFQWWRHKQILITVWRRSYPRMKKSPDLNPFRREIRQIVGFDVTREIPLTSWKPPNFGTTSSTPRRGSLWRHFASWPFSWGEFSFRLIMGDLEKYIN